MQCPDKLIVDKYAFVLSLAVTSPHLHASIVIKSVITFAGENYPASTDPGPNTQNSEIWRINICTFSRNFLGIKYYSLHVSKINFKRFKKTDEQLNFIRNHGNMPLLCCTKDARVFSG